MIRKRTEQVEALLSAENALAIHRLSEEEVGGEGSVSQVPVLSPQVKAF